MDVVRSQLSLSPNDANGRPAIRGPAVSSARCQWALLAIAFLGCEHDSRVRDHGMQTPTQLLAVPTGGVVDSALPLDEALRRFRVGLPRVDSLSGGARSRDQLIRRFVRAVERSDTAALRAMIISRAEFGHLYYPTSPYTREPTKQAAALAWFFVIEPSKVGITRVLGRFGGAPLGFRGYSCTDPPRCQGDNVVWQGCALRIRTADGTSVRHFFGPILERGGQFKFLSYANDL
jgi:hypothetical protein